jgi:predicted amidophosphoribosyltransferase
VATIKMGLYTSRCSECDSPPDKTNTCPSCGAEFTKVEADRSRGERFYESDWFEIDLANKTRGFTNK